MSGIVGFFNLDGRPADGRLIARMLGTIARRGPDASRGWTDGAVGLGHCLLSATPESIGEVQPHTAADEALSIVFDGRVDNRHELLEAFAKKRIPVTAGFDGALVLAAYQCWGPGCAARLLGDFAFAIWDRDHHRVFCARDAVAQKPFYYHHGRDLFLFASEPQALLAHPSVDGRPNEGMIAEYLSIITSTTDTLFAHVHRLAPGHSITVSPGGAQLERYWSIDPARAIRHRTIGDYADHLRALLRQVVADRLRSSTDTGVMLSGGIDSSSALAIATQLGNANPGTRPCRAFSLIDPGGVLDEREFMDRTVAALGCVSHHYTAARIPAGAYRDVTRQRADLASSPSARLMTAIKAGARERGIRVLLSGVGSDEWLGGSLYHSADLFRSLRWGALAAYWRSVWSAGLITDPRTAAKITTWPLLSRRVRKRIKFGLGYDGVPRWINRDFARRVGLADRLYPSTVDPLFPTIAQRTIFRDMTSGLMVHGIEDEERSAAEFGLEVRYPFADRRVMEFGLAIPEELRGSGSTRKVVLREAMRGTLPDDVRLRDASPNGGSVFMPTLRAFADEGLFHRPAIEREGWTEPGAVQAFFDRILARQAGGDPDYTDDVWPMWSVAAVELWMQEVAGGSAGDQEEHTCEMMTRAPTSATQGRDSAGGSGRT